MSGDESGQEYSEVPVLSEDVPVVMPELPLRLDISTSQQYKALGDPTRSRILGIIQQQPATAKQIADRLGIPPGTINHHLQTLEAAGLAQVVARRIIRGIVAKYYTRTARIFMYGEPDKESGIQSMLLNILSLARDEFGESLASYGHEAGAGGFPHARISRERVEYYERRLLDLIDEMVAEPPDPTGKVIGMVAAFFVSPTYMQVQNDPPSEEE